MKELEEIVEAPGVFDQAEVKKTLTLLARQPLKKGHKVFEVSFKDGVLSVEEAEVTKEIVMAPSTIKKGVTSPFKKQKVVIKDGCHYITALNKKNVVKKILSSFNN
jgi:hypothetical protein